MTTVGLVIGTAGYLSPEQATGGEPGAESDVYSLGLVVLECLTGEKAYPGTPVEAVTARLTRDPWIPETLPAAWASLISQMTSRDPAMRPNSLEVAVTTREIAEQLNGWIAPGHADAETDSTAAMLPPTMVLPAAAEVAPTAATVAYGAAAAPTAATAATVAFGAARAPVAAGGAAIGAETPPATDRRRRGRLAAIIVGSAGLILAFILGATALLSGPQAAVPPTPTPSPTSPAPASPTPTVTPANTPVNPGPPHGGPGNGPGKDKGKGGKGK